MCCEVFDFEGEFELPNDDVVHKAIATQYPKKVAGVLIQRHPCCVVVEYNDWMFGFLAPPLTLGGRAVGHSNIGRLPKAKWPVNQAQPPETLSKPQEPAPKQPRTGPVTVSSKPPADVVAVVDTAPTKPPATPLVGPKSPNIPSIPCPFPSPSPSPSLSAGGPPAPATTGGKRAAAPASGAASTSTSTSTTTPATPPPPPRPSTRYAGAIESYVLKKTRVRRPPAAVLPVPCDYDAIWSKISSECAHEGSLVEDMKALRISVLPEIISEVDDESAERHAAMSMPAVLATEWPNIASRCRAIVAHLTDASQFMTGVVAWLQGGAAALTTASTSASHATASDLVLPPLPRLRYTAAPAAATATATARAPCRVPSVIMQLVGDIVDAFAQEGGSAATPTTSSDNTPGEGEAEGDVDVDGGGAGAAPVSLGDVRMIGRSTDYDDDDDDDGISNISEIAETCDSVTVSRYSLGSLVTDAILALQALFNITLPPQKQMSAPIELISRLQEHCRSVTQKIDEVLGKYKTAVTRFEKVKQVPTTTKATAHNST
ncbi:hypothetical protein Pelo_9838 [Pelomyxa schiedti]|nr:hypothetical protein Pelo_9838 [Pelomyxa schiedti]